MTASVRIAAAALAVAAALAAGPAASAQPAPEPDADPPAAPASEPADPGADAAPGAVQPPAPGVFDLTGRVREAINGWVGELVASVLDVPLDLLGETLLATPQVSGPGRVRQLWSVSAGIANGFYVLLILVGGVVVAGHESVQTRHSAKEIAPRLVIGMVASNLSLAAAGAAITAANALSAALMEPPGAAAAGLARVVRRVVLPSLGPGFTVWVGLAAAALVVTLVLTCVVRTALVVLLVAGAPLALACHALPHTEGLALLWWRALGACLGTQVGQALTLTVGLEVFFSSQGRGLLGLPTAGGILDLFVLASLLWIMARIPVWAGRVVFAGRGSRTGRMARSYVVFRLVRRAVAKV